MKIQCLLVLLAIFGGTVAAVAPSTVATSTTVASSTVAASTTAVPSTVGASTTVAPSTVVASSTVAASTVTSSGNVTTTTVQSTARPIPTGTTPFVCQDYQGEKNCQQYVSKCKDPAYIPLLTGICDKTCGYCSDGSVTTPGPQAPTSFAPCVDLSPNCVNYLKNGFCTNTFYTCQQKKAQCAKSCKLCNTVC